MNRLSIKYQRIFLHIAFWLSLLVLLSVEVLENTLRIDFSSKFLIYIYVVVSFALTTYVNIYVLMPQLLLKKRYLLYILSVLCLICLVAFVNDEFLHLFFQTERMFIGRCLTLLSFTFFTFGIKIIRNDAQKNLRINELERVQNQQELQLLKSQINPHFLFNTLNNLYALTLTDNKKAADATLKLSDLMRYMFTIAQKPFVALDKEMDYLTNYINLEQLRLNENAVVKINKQGDFSTKNIAPMLLLPFVENVFKHGVETQRQNIIVEIDVALQENDLFFQVKNTKPQNVVVEKTGTGLINVKKRLELIYPENHELTIQDEANLFTIKLWINL